MASYNFYQPLVKSSWDIHHTLNSKFLAIDVMKLIAGGSYEKVQAFTVTQVDDNNIIITFPSPVSGRARIVTK